MQKQRHNTVFGIVLAIGEAARCRDGFARIEIDKFEHQRTFRQTDTRGGVNFSLETRRRFVKGIVGANSRNLKIARQLPKSDRVFLPFTTRRAKCIDFDRGGVVVFQPDTHKVNRAGISGVGTAFKCARRVLPLEGNTQQTPRGIRNAAQFGKEIGFRAGHEHRWASKDARCGRQPPIAGQIHAVSDKTFALVEKTIAVEILGIGSRLTLCPIALRSIETRGIATQDIRRVLIHIFKIISRRIAGHSNTREYLSKDLGLFGIGQSIQTDILFVNDDIVPCEQVADGFVLCAKATRKSLSVIGVIVHGMIERQEHALRNIAQIDVQMPIVSPNPEFEKFRPRQIETIDIAHHPRP